MIKSPCIKIVLFILCTSSKLSFTQILRNQKYPQTNKFNIRWIKFQNLFFFYLEGILEIIQLAFNFLVLQTQKLKRLSHSPSKARKQISFSTTKGPPYINHTAFSQTSTHSLQKLRNLQWIQPQVISVEFLRAYIFKIVFNKNKTHIPKRQTMGM